MTIEEIKNWMQKNCDWINKFIRLMCQMHIVDATYTIAIECGIGFESWCRTDIANKTIRIHVELEPYLALPPEDKQDAQWKKSHQKLVDILGHETTENELYGYYFGTAMHEFMHACITRPGKICAWIASKFPMQKTNPTPYEREWYKQRVEEFIHLLFNGVCDARIENIGKNLYNVEQYFNLMRYVDYLMATDLPNTKSFAFAYSLLQLGVIGKLPQYKLEDEAVKAIERITKHEVRGSAKTKNLLDEFICEPDPTISSRYFAKWFDDPVFHEYIAKLIFEEIETQSAAAEALAKQLAQMVNEVTVVSNGTSGAGTAIKLDLPTLIIPKNNDSPSPAEQQDQTSGGNTQKNAGGNCKGAEGIQHDSNKNHVDNSKTSDDSSCAGGKKGNNDGNKAGGDCRENNKRPDGSPKGEIEGHNGCSEGGKDTKDSKANTEGNANTNPGSNQSNVLGDANDANDTKASNKSKNGDKISDTPSKDGNVPDEHKTFDENGNWLVSEKPFYGDSSADPNDLKAKLDATIQSVAQARAAQIGSSEPKCRSKKTKYQQTSDAYKVDDSFVPAFVAPSKVKSESKPLRAAIKRLFDDNSQRRTSGLKSGALNTSALYRLRTQDFAVFQKRNNKEVVNAVYYIIWDGSGSMYGQKQQESGYACAVIEEAIKGLFPLKIVSFNSTGGSVVHRIVRDFTDKKTAKNASYSFACTYSFTGGNKDGDAIKMARTELDQRKEKEKFLFVLSDGAPSAYCSMELAINTVKQEVDEARKSGIHVFPIFFGSEGERERQITTYYNMYGKSVISCEPGEIVSYLTKIIKKTIFS